MEEQTSCQGNRTATPRINQNNSLCFTSVKLTKDAPTHMAYNPFVIYPFLKALESMGEYQTSLLKYTEKISGNPKARITKNNTLTSGWQIHIYSRLPKVLFKVSLYDVWNSFPVYKSKNCQQSTMIFWKPSKQRAIAGTRCRFRNKSVRVNCVSIIYALPTKY